MRRINLHDRLDALCERYLGRVLDIQINWGRWPTSTDSWDFAAYWHDGDESHIELCPVLASKSVPLYFVDHVIWHEACHAALYERTDDCVADHGPAFRMLEVLYRHHGKSIRWESANVRRLERLIKAHNSRR